jgi:hypothetical protein
LFERRAEPGFDIVPVALRPAGIGGRRRVNAAPQGMRAQHHPGMLGKVAVHLEGNAGVFILGQDGIDRRQLNPVAIGGRFALETAPECQHIDDHLGAGHGAHAAGRQPHSTEKLGHAVDMRPRRLIQLAHSAGAGDEEGDTAWPQPRDRTGDEVIQGGFVFHRR